MVWVSTGVADKVCSINNWLHFQKLPLLCPGSTQKLDVWLLGFAILFNQFIQESLFIAKPLNFSASNTFCKLLSLLRVWSIGLFHLEGCNTIPDVVSQVCSILIYKEKKLYAKITHLLSGISAAIFQINACLRNLFLLQELFWIVMRFFLTVKYGQQQIWKLL